MLPNMMMIIAIIRITISFTIYKIGKRIIIEDIIVDEMID